MLLYTNYINKNIKPGVEVQMGAGILGEKIGMTRIFTKNGESIPVTVILAGPCRVIQRKNLEKDGYNAVQLGFKEVNKKKVSKPIIGHFSQFKVEPLKYIREFKVYDSNKYSSGMEVKVDIFKEGDKVDIISISKGKGFAGAIKRHHFSGGPKTHGQKEYFRSVGSMGATDAARVFKGKKLPGHMGKDRVSMKNLKVVKVDLERNLILVKGSVPGVKGTMVIINKIV
jgi:large subunit ribosomal protein L3